MSCDGYVFYNLPIKISQNILQKELESFIVYQKAIEEKLENDDSRSEHYHFKEMIGDCDQNIEKINIMNEEMQCLNLLKLFIDHLDRMNMGLALKSKWLIDENKWLESQVNFFQDELKKLDQEWIGLESERLYKLNFYKMRNYQNYVDITEEIDSWSNNNNEYEPDELYSSDIKPFFKIVKENMLEWRNELAIAWCNEILSMFIEKEGEISESVADLYSFIGRIYKLNQQYVEAKYNFEKAVQINEILKNKNQKGVNLTFLGIIYEKEKRYDKAEKYFKKAIVGREKTIGRIHPDMSDLYCRLGSLYNKTCKWKDSIANYLRALPPLENTFEIDSQILNLYLTLSDNYIEIRAEENAYTYLEKYCRSIFKQKSLENILISPISNLLQKNENNFNKNAVLNLWSTYGPIEKCCPKEFLLIMSKYFTIFNHNDALGLLNEWCDMSQFPYDVIKYKVELVPEIVKRPSSSHQFRRSSTKDSNSSSKSSKLKSLRNFMKSPIESVKKHI